MNPLVQRPGFVENASPSSQSNHKGPSRRFSLLSVSEDIMVDQDDGNKSGQNNRGDPVPFPKASSARAQPKSRFILPRHLRTKKALGILIYEKASESVGL